MTQMTKILREIGVLRDTLIEEDADTSSAIIKQLAIAAKILGVDLEDPQALDGFVRAVRDVTTRERAALKTQLRKWTPAKTRAAVKTAKQVP